jgi:hypothetical protein
MKILLTLLFIFVNSVAFSQSDTSVTKSGLKYIVIEKGTGIKSEAGKEVIVHYTGWLTDGRKFDSSLDRNVPFSFILGEQLVIKGWEEGLAFMSEGDKFRLIIPPDMAYGSKGAGNVIPPDATLIFDVQLLSVIEPRMAISDTLYSIIKVSGLQSAIDFYNRVKKDGNQFKFDESELNTLGYQLLSEKRVKDAIEILKINAAEYPGSFNVYDSLGEAYMHDGDNENAKINYKRSLEINPQNENGILMLKKLENQK